MEHLYGAGERRAQLEELTAALEALVALLRDTPGLEPAASGYEAALEEARRLSSREPDRESLSALGRSVPDLFYRFKEWEPPAERGPDGAWREPEWFAALEPKLQRALEAARKLSQLGYY